MNVNKVANKIQSGTTHSCKQQRHTGEAKKKEEEGGAFFPVSDNKGYR